MRRKDREITDRDELIQIMKGCDVCRLAFNDDKYPYILPLNFGLYVDEEKIELYFHGAKSGTKYDLIEKNRYASFEMDCDHQLHTSYDRKQATMSYRSVIGHGTIDIPSDEEKKKALTLIMEQYGQPDFPINEAVMKNTAIFRLRVEGMSGKCRPVPAWSRNDETDRS